MSEYYRESLDLNKNLKINYKQSLEATIGNILKCCFNDRGIDVEMETFSALLQSMKSLEIYEDNSVFCSYDLDSNTILFNKNKNIDKDKQYYDFLSTVMDIISTNYIDGKFTQGLTFKDEDGKKYGKVLNDRLKDRLILLSFGETKYNESVKDFFIDSPNDSATLLDEMFVQLDSVISSNDLISFYINGRSDLLLQKLGDYGKAYIKNLDKYNKENSALIRNECDLLMKSIESMKKQENSQKIA
jgi:hypothetical protein